MTPKCEHCPVPDPEPCHCVTLCTDPRAGDPGAIPDGAATACLPISSRNSPSSRTPKPSPRPIELTAFVTTAQLQRDALTLARALPPSIDAVVAIARSGLMPGTIAAVHLHLPLFTVTRETGVLDLGAGYRMRGKERAEPAHVLLIDDTVGIGQEMTACLPIVQARFPSATVTRAVVYCNPDKLHLIDLAYAAYPGPHYLEWGWMNYLGHYTLADFDGVLCDDCPAGDDDDGPRYRDWLSNAKPKYLPRQTALGALVTARHERYRELTVAWLAQHRVAFDRLIMRDWDYYPDHSHDDQVGTWKAEVFRASAGTIFVESSPAQAETIHRLTGKIVICPTSARVWPKRAHAVAVAPTRRCC